MKRPATYRMDEANIAALDRERQARIAYGYSRNSCTLSALVNLAVALAYGPGRQDTPDWEKAGEKIAERARKERAKHTPTPGGPPAGGVKRRRSARLGTQVAAPLMGASLIGMALRNIRPVPKPPKKRGRR